MGRWGFKRNKDGTWDVTIDIPDEQLAMLSLHAQRQGITTEELARRVIFEGCKPSAVATSV